MSTCYVYLLRKNRLGPGLESPLDALLDSPDIFCKSLNTCGLMVACETHEHHYLYVKGPIRVLILNYIDSNIYIYIYVLCN